MSSTVCCLLLRAVAAKVLCNSAKHAWLLAGHYSANSTTSTHTGILFVLLLQLQRLLDQCQLAVPLASFKANTMPSTLTNTVIAAAAVAAVVTAEAAGPVPGIHGCAPGLFQSQRGGSEPVGPSAAAGTA
jgi:hypothetical protein